MDKLIMNRYYRKLKYANLEIELEFKYELTIICGDSAVGRTFIYNLLSEEPSKDKIIFINYLTPSDILEYIVLSGKIKNRLIVIDNADILLSEERVVNGIRNDNSNQYIVMMRKYDSLAKSQKNIARLIRRENRLVLYYTLLENFYLYEE